MTHHLKITLQVLRIEELQLSPAKAHLRANFNGKVDELCSNFSSKFNLLYETIRIDYIRDFTKFITGLEIHILNVSDFDLLIFKKEKDLYLKPILDVIQKYNLSSHIAISDVSFEATSKEFAHPTNASQFFQLPCIKKNNLDYFGNLTSTTFTHSTK